MGAMLAFKESFYERTERLKHLFGGALRQSGIIAAAGLYALENHVNRLAEDHDNAMYLANRLSEISEIQIEYHENSTNRVFFTWQGKNIFSLQFLERCIEKGVRFSQVDQNRFRAVTYLGINKKTIDKVITIMKDI